MKTKAILIIIAIIALFAIGYKMTGNVTNNQINNENTITENKMSITTTGRRDTSVINKVFDFVFLISFLIWLIS